MEADVKKYHFKREKYREGLVTSQEQRKQAKIESTIEKIRNLEISLGDLSETKLSKEDKTMIEMAQEWFKIIQKAYGEEFQRLAQENDERITSIYRTTDKFINELEGLKQKEEKSLGND